MYVCETKRTLREHFKEPEHRQATNNSLQANATAVVPSHFNQPGHSITDIFIVFTPSIVFLLERLFEFDLFGLCLTFLALV